MTAWPLGERAMAARIRAHDWSATPLGPMAAWSERLKLMVEQVLASPIVASLVCGPARILIYNEAAARLYGDRHPAGLGRPLPETFPEGWATVAPFYARAFAGETVEVAGQPLDTRGEGAANDVFDVLLTPVRETDGRIAFVHMTGFEIGARKRAEAALRESEAKLRTLFDTIDQGYCVTEVQLDDQGDVVDLIVREANRNWEAMTGMSNPLHRRVREMLPALEGHWLDYYGEVFKTGRPVRHENYLSDVDRWFSAHYSLMGDLGSRLIAVVFEDITARKKAEAGLKESEERQAFLLALSDTLRSITSAREIKAAACALLGRKLGTSRVYFVEMNEAKRTGFVHEDYTAHGVPSVEGRYDFDIFPATYERLRSGATWVVPDLAAETDLPPGERAVFESAAVIAWIDVPLLKDDHVEAVLCVTQTEPRRWTGFEARLVEETAERLWSAVRRGRVEVALRESEERLRQFGEASSDILWIRDAETLQWVYLTPAFERIYGIDRATALAGDNMTGWLDLIVPDDRQTAVEAIERVRAGERVAFEYRVRQDDGTVRWLRNTDFPMRDGAGRVCWIGGVGRDVTEEKASAQRLEVLVNELQHRSRNLLGVVTAMANRTIGRGSSAESFLVRLKALGRAQALLSQSGADTVAVEALVRAELAAHADSAPDRIVIDGPAVTLISQQVQNFALALHELTTNAFKYGALKDEAGHLSVTWELIRTVAGTHLALNWVETGVEVPPEAATRRGYGRELIEQALVYALGGRTDYVLGPSGVRCRIKLPIA